MGDGTGWMRVCALASAENTSSSQHLTTSTSPSPNYSKSAYHATALVLSPVNRAATCSISTRLWLFRPRLPRLSPRRCFSPTLAEKFHTQLSAAAMASTGVNVSCARSDARQCSDSDSCAGAAMVRPRVRRRVRSLPPVVDIKPRPKQRGQGRIQPPREPDLTSKGRVCAEERSCRVVGLL
jgi:hypothetical protein